MSLSLNQDVRVGDTVYHVQTEFVGRRKKIVTNIFKEGKIVKKLELEVKGEEGVEELTRSFHDNVVRRLIGASQTKSMKISKNDLEDLLPVLSNYFGVLAYSIAQEAFELSKGDYETFLELILQEIEEECREELKRDIDSFLTR